MIKRRIAIASVLKPIDDTRMFEKMGVTLAKTGQYDVYVIGQPSNYIPAHAGINFTGLSHVKRLSLSRLLIPVRTLSNLFKLKPEALIVNTHELLIVSLVIRILFGTRIVYDIRENYYRNIRFSEAFPSWQKFPVALWVRVKEKVTAPFFHHFILAENAYQTELNFIGRRFTILENRAIKPQAHVRQTRPSPTRLLFTGTVAKSTGIFEAIELATSLHQLDQNIELNIVGYCGIPAVRLKIAALISDKPFIKLTGLDKLVPHQEILDAIARSDFGIIHYPSSPHTVGSIPTKLYEYMAYELPILAWPDQSFSARIVEHKAGLLISDSAEALLEKMKTDTFYPTAPENIFWEGEKFIDLVQQLVS